MGTSEGARKGHNPEADAKRAESMRKRFEDPEYRARHAEKIREARARMSKERKSEAAKKSHTPGSDAQRRKSMQRKWETLEYQEKRAELEQTPEMKAARSEAMKVANNDPEKRREQSEYMKDRFATDEEYKAKQKEWTQRAADDQDIKEARSEAMKRAWLENPELFVNSLKATLEAVRSPEGRERQRWAYARRAAAAPTTPFEHAVCLILNEMKVPYFVHKVIEGKEADIYVPSHKLDIEVDGVNHVGKGAVHDQKRDKFLQGKGHNVLRLKHGSITNGSFITRLQEALK